ncbi:MAG: GAF domain-containing protein [Chloroflexota bacterium]
MAKNPKSNAQKKTAQDTIQRRITNMFAEHEPPAYVGLRQLEALKARITELEGKLAQQPEDTEKTWPKITGITPSSADDFGATPQQTGDLKQTRTRVSIQTKITLWTGLCLLFATIILAWYSVSTLRQTAIDGAEKEALAIAEAQASAVKGQLDEILATARTLAHSLAAVKDPVAPVSLSREQANAMLRKVLSENPSFLGTYTLWEPNAFDGLDTEYRWKTAHDSTGRFIPYWIRGDNGSVYVEALEQYETPGIGDWYLIPRNTKQEVTIAPLIYPIQGEDTLMASFVVPIVQNDKFYGIAGVDAPIAFVQQVVDSIDLYDGAAQAVLLTDTGTLIAVYQQPELVNQPANSIYEDIEQLLPRLSAEETFTSLSPDGKYLRIFAPISLGKSGTRWAMGLIIPFSKITASATTAAIQQVSISAGLILFTIALLWFLAGQIVRPVKALTQAASAVSQGNLSIVANVHSNDETGVLAAAFNTMTGNLKNLVSTLEQRVTERTQDLETASEVGKAITEKVANQYEMMAQAVEIIRERFNLYYTQIYIVDPSGRNLVLSAGTGEVGTQLMRKSHYLPIGLGSINGRAASEKRAVVIESTEKNANFLPNPLLPLTRCEMSVPLMVGDIVVGVLDMQSERPGALNETNLPAFTALAGQLAVAIQNASLFAQTTQAHAEMEEQARRLTAEGWQGFLDGIERSERIGYCYAQNEIIPLVDVALPSIENVNVLSAPINITGAKVGEIRLEDEPGRTWTAAENEIIQATATQIAQQVENLRLLAQAESYRAKAEQAVRRLMREGWDEYLNQNPGTENGFIYDGEKVTSMEEQNDALEPIASYDIKVHGEPVGQFSIAGTGVFSFSEDELELVKVITEQLSAHIENLRLSVQTEQALSLSQKLAKREQTLRQITNAVRSSTNPETILRTAARELGNILGRRTMVQLTPPESRTQVEPIANNWDSPDSLVS